MRRPLWVECPRSTIDRRLRVARYSMPVGARGHVAAHERMSAPDKGATMKSQSAVPPAWSAVAFVLMLLLASVSLFAQANTGAIVGTVHDSSGGVLASVPITIRNEETNISRTVVTSASGDFSAPLLPPGSYEVSAAVAGFNEAVFRNVQLQVNQTVRMDFNLTVGAVQ